MCSRIIMSLLSLLLTTLLHTLTLRVRATAAPATFGGRNETDRLALLAFKSNILQDPQGVMTSWNDSLHFCQWEGVTCSNRHARAVTINLTSKALVGSLSPFIGNLSFLTQINLDNNTFQGEIPPQLGRLFRLRSLSLRKNFLQGKIPASLSNCSNLINLRLSNNHLVGEIPNVLGSLSKLQQLWVHVNSLTGEIPRSIGNLTSLQSLGATYNNLTGSLPNSMGQLTNLKILDMGVNQLSGMIPPSIYNLSLLNVISLPYNQLQGSLPQGLGLMLPHLKFLQLGGNQLSGTLPRSLSNASELERVDIPLNNFTGKIPTDFGSLQNLWGLVLGGNNLGSGEPDEMSFLVSLANCSDLHVLELGTNQLRGPLPSKLGNFSTDLFYFSLMGNSVPGDIPSWIGDLVGLTQLLLGDNEFSGTIPTTIGNLHKLQRLTLHNNSLAGELPSSIGRLTMLNELTLNNNNLQGSIPQSFGNCQNLQLLDLSENNLSSTIPKELFNISTLSILLNLSHNHLFGSVPLEVGNLVKLVELDVSDNYLYAEIPNTLGRCISLVNLFMDGNFFQGLIPPSLVSLRGIAILDLSCNNFSGQIPQFLETFSLTSLNLSYNDLVGEVPRQGAFANSSAISVVGNTKLCGGIPELQLPRCTMSEPKKRKAPHVRTIIIVTILFTILGVIMVSSASLYFFWFKRKSMVGSTGLQVREQFINVSYEKLLKATNGFSSVNLIGAGTFGLVYKGILGQDERAVAVKVFNLQKAGASKSFMAECEALRMVRHRNLIKIVSSCSSINFQGNDFKALIYAFMPNGSLERWLHMSPEADRSQILNLHQRIKIAIDVAFALDYLHNQCESPIVHCDLKPSNILLDEDMVACVGDFGLAKFIFRASDQSSIGIRGTIGYAAPEYGLGSEVSVKGDMYSYGILVLEMMTGKRPTDPMFQDGLNLNKYAKMFFPDRVLEVVDPIFLHHLSKEEASTSASRNSRPRQAMRMEDCLVLMIKLGVACSLDSAKDRMDINHVLRELHSVSNTSNQETSTGISEA